MNCLECLRRFSQVVLIIVNIFVALLGFAVMVIGIWAKVDSRQYFLITEDNQTFTQVSVLLIIIGLFVMIVGGIGVVGGIFATKLFGRITLGLYAVVLTLLVICEISGGIAAGVKKGSIQSFFNNSANITFQKAYRNDTDSRSETDSWDTVQRGLGCCGLHNYEDYHLKFQNFTVPASCCQSNYSEGECKALREDIRTDPYLVYQQGCVDRVVSGFTDNLGAIAGGAIVLGLIQILGIVLACFVAIYKQQENKYEVV